MLTRYIPLPILIHIDKNCLSDIKSVLKLNNLTFSRPLVVSGSNATKSIAEIVLNQFGKSKHYSVTSNVLEEVSNLKSLVDSFRPDLIISVGGGKVLDVSKVVSAERPVPLLALPTTLSNDGIVSPVAVIKSNGKIMSVGAKAPMGVIFDLEVIKDSPRKNILAGMGDVISNLSACEDWFLAHKLKKEKIDLFSFIISRVASKSILDLKHPIGSYEFFEVLSQAIILSGMSMIISGSSRPASGSEHLISHAIDKYFPRSNLHGEQVAVATLFVTALRKQFDLLEILKNFYLTYGLPTNPSHLNLSKEEFLKAVLKAPNMRKERFTILNIVKKEELRKAYNVAFNDD